MGLDFRFLGQNVTIGSFTGRPNGRTLILSQGTSFSILRYFMENVEGGLSNPNGATAIFKSGSTNIFAIAYKNTSLGWSTWFKWARSDMPIPDGDNPPSYSPWNGWTNVGTYTDHENLTMAEILDNSFAMYEIDSDATPYWNGGTNQDLSFNTLTNGGVNLYVCFQLKNYDGTTPVEYTGATPILFHGGNITNWIDNINVTDPSYYLDGQGMTPQHIYNILDIDGAEIINDFTKDTATTAGGWGGNYGYRGSEWGIDEPISLDALGTGLVSMYSPTKAQLQTFASFLWSDSFINAIKKAWAEPMDSIISFGIVPIDLSSYCYNTASQVYIGNVDTGCQMFELKKQKLKYNDAVCDMGTINVELNFTNCFDFEPFCTATLYLPFVGFVPIKINDIMGGSIHVAYNIDLLSGDCVAYVEVNRNDLGNMKWGTEKHVAYQYRGNCMIQIPLSCRDYSSFYSNIMMAGIPAMGSALSGDIGGAVKGGVQGAVSALLEGPDIQRSGNYSGSIAGMSNRTPCLIITRTMQHLPDGYNEFEGYPCFLPYVLGDLTGFTMVEKVIDNTIPATDTEKQMIEEALMKGVIL